MSSNLTGSTIASTYNQLLHIDGGPNATEKTVYSGTGTPTALKLSTGSAAVDNIRFNGNVISTTDANGSLYLTPDGSGSVVMAKVNISGGVIAGITDLAIADGGTGASDAATARTNLGLDTMSQQAASAVAITGGTIAGITFSGTISGATLFTAGTVQATIVEGGNLRVSGNSITSLNSNGDINLAPDGSGVVYTDNLQFTNNTISTRDTNGNLFLTPNGTGVVSTPTLQVTSSLGYATGAGGTVTQITDKSTAVTINKLSGQIVTHNESMNANTTKVFTVNNSLVAATDVPILALAAGNTAGQYGIAVDGVGAGTFNIRIYHDNGGGALAEALTINFVVIKGVAA